MSTYRAYIHSSPQEPLSIQDLPTPNPTSGQVLVAVLATPLLPYAKDVLSGAAGFPLSRPLTPGISAIARVVSTGPDATHLSPNQLVFCNPAIFARDDMGSGAAMLHGWMGGMTAQSNKLMTDAWRNGAWAEKMLVPLENVVLLNETRLVKDLGYEIVDLCWMNELLVPYGGLLAAALEPGCTVIVAPATGHFGGCAVKVALAMGAGCVVAAGRNKSVLDKISKMDGRVMTVVLRGDVTTDSKALRDATPSAKGADIYIDFSPSTAGGSIHPQACVAALKKGGQAVLMGGVNEDISLNYGLLMFNNISVRGNFMYGLDAPSKLRALLESGLLSLKGLAPKVFGIENLTEGLDFAEKHGGMDDLTVLAPQEDKM